MTAVRVVLQAYYERLHERMEAAHAALTARIDELLGAEIDAQGFGPMTQDKVEAYREACLAFVAERLEMYNPVGIQYTFSGQTTKHAAELEFQLNWHDSRAEFEELVAQARTLADEGPPDERLTELADRLIRKFGAYPDRSIIAAYAEKPTLQKLPDFIVATAIEQVVCSLIIDDG
ncbi:MAG: hypothetical protein JW993_06130 [Sedimentisphaerales bacterium]|nr:hypothetical protein [Sedimentisphaerales bacterium]